MTEKRLTEIFTQPVSQPDFRSSVVCFLCVQLIFSHVAHTPTLDCPYQSVYLNLSCSHCVFIVVSRWQQLESSIQLPLDSSAESCCLHTFSHSGILISLALICYLLEQTRLYYSFAVQYSNKPAHTCSLCIQRDR